MYMMYIYTIIYFILMIISLYFLLPLKIVYSYTDSNDTPSENMKNLI
jgi:hypothetical protein